jgi:hypothetical protein
MKRSNLARPTAGISVEAIVGTSVAFLGLGMFAVAIISANGDKALRRQSGSELAARPHDARPFLESTRASEPVATGQSDHSAANTIVRNGLTVVSPPLLVPVVDLDGLPAANGTDGTPQPGQLRASGRRSHYAHRAHARGQYTVKHIVGLAASRRLVTVGP